MPKSKFKSLYVMSNGSIFFSNNNLYNKVLYEFFEKDFLNLTHFKKNDNIEIKIEKSSKYKRKYN